MANTYMPITISLAGRQCLVVGGGRVALRKVETLLDYDTSITVVAPDVEDKLQYYAERGKIKLEKRPYRTSEAETFGLVIAASADAELNRRISRDCRTARVLVNVVDDPAECDFIFPAVVRRDLLTVAVATDGRAPFVSGYLRLLIDDIFPEHWSRLMRYAADFRKKVQSRWSPDPAQKQACYERFLGADWKSILKEQNAGEIAEELERMLEGSTGVSDTNPDGDESEPYE